MTQFFGVTILYNKEEENYQMVDAKKTITIDCKEMRIIELKPTIWYNDNYKGCLENECSSPYHGYSSDDQLSSDSDESDNHNNNNNDKKSETGNSNNNDKENDNESIVKNENLSINLSINDDDNKEFDANNPVNINI